MIKVAHRTPAANAADDNVEIGMQRRLAPAERDYGGAQIGQTIDPSQHCFKRNERGSLVVFVAVGAIQVAAPDRHDLRQNRVRCRLHGAHEHARLADLSVSLTSFMKKAARRWHRAYSRRSG